MVIFKKISELQSYLNSYTSTGKTVGFIPTMGALHAGHLSLIKEAKASTDVVVCSIFVNPTQFNNKADYEKYPVSEGADIELLVDGGCDILFLPSVKEIYPDGLIQFASFDFGYLDTLLEGKYRPGHFKGVAQVVNRLLEIVSPDKLFMGQKDYQQCLIVKKLLQLTGKDNKIELVICPTLREQDGLAMSSRNRRLSESQRSLAAVIYQCLVSIEAKQNSMPFAVVQKECMDILNGKGFVTEYVAIANSEDLSLMSDYTDSRKTVALIATKIGDIRLIDNMLLSG
ncbi:MAG: pantoate--beta-alanine ligase [Taibaiella sp.]|nr:pantoate--beta-alanine ligase [Taibaiella sp.]